MPSFSRKVKEEICFNDFDIASGKALLCALIKMTGSLAIGHGMLLTLRSENAKVISKAFKLLREYYDPQMEVRVSRKMKLKKNNIYMLRVSNPQQILSDLDLMDGLTFLSIPTGKIVNTSDTRRAYLAGIFLGCGSVNDPSTSNYHLEMSVNDEDHAIFISSLMNSFELRAKVIKRRNKYVVYLKSARKIGDFLRAVGTSQSAADFETTRISRSFANDYNRINNCDIANEMKAFDASMRQLRAISYIIEQDALSLLSERVKRAALIRLDNQDATLKELVEAYESEYDEAISKATLSRYFKKIETEAKKLGLTEK
ncbi:MAG: DNA-binding protein WhiA [Erysipelotrichaceae bacterium]|nr:DNA-binding protein WhiA [Erysipelotrichaceae bacterium]